MLRKNSMDRKIEAVLFPSIDDMPRAVHLGTIKRKVLRIKQQQQSKTKSALKESGKPVAEKEGKSVIA